MKFVLAATLTLIVLSTPAFADMKDDLRICAGLHDDKARLACFDVNAAQWAGTPPANATPAPKPTDFKKLAPTDLSVETHKWDGLNIETSLNCFYADVSEFRCFDMRTFAKLRVDFSELDAAGENYLKAHCDTTATADGRACLVKLHFTYDGYNRQETGGLVGHMTFVHPRDGRGEIVK